MNKEVFLAKVVPQLLKSFTEQGSTVELFSDGAVYSLSVFIDGHSTKPTVEFFDNYKEADMAFQDAILATTEKGTLH